MSEEKKTTIDFASAITKEAPPTPAAEHKTAGLMHLFSSLGLPKLPSELVEYITELAEHRLRGIPLELKKTLLLLYLEYSIPISLNFPEKINRREIVFFPNSNDRSGKFPQEFPISFA